MHLLSNLLEGRHFPLRIETWVQTLFCHASIFKRTLSRLIEEHKICTAQTEIRAERATIFILLPFDHHAHYPEPRPDGSTTRYKPLPSP